MVTPEVIRLAHHFQAHGVYLTRIYIAHTKCLQVHHFNPNVPSFSYHSPRRTLSLPSPIMEENIDLSDEENWKENTKINDINESDDGQVLEDWGSQNRFSPRQTRALVENWWTAITKLESSDSLKHWKLIQEHVNKLGSPNVDQLKNKMISLKKKYKEVEANNSKSGHARMTCKSFEEIDSVLGTRDVVVIPAVKSSGQPVHNTTVENTPPAPPNSSSTNRR